MNYLHENKKKKTMISGANLLIAIRKKKVRNMNRKDKISVLAISFSFTLCFRVQIFIIVKKTNNTNKLYRIYN